MRKPAKKIKQRQGRVGGDFVPQGRHNWSAVLLYTTCSLCFFVVRRAREENDHARDWRRETGEAHSVSFFLPPSFLAPTWMIVEGYIINNVYINIVVLAL